MIPQFLDTPRALRASVSAMKKLVRIIRTKVAGGGVRVKPTVRLVAVIEEEVLDSSNNTYTSYYKDVRHLVVRELAPVQFAPLEL